MMGNKNNLKATMQVGASNFDLSNITVKGGHSQMLEDLGLKKDYTEVNGHQIREDDDCVRCRHCENEYEVPELIRGSSGFNEVVYRLYLMGKFKQYACNNGLRSVGDSIDHSVHTKGGNPISNNYKPPNHQTKTTNLNAKVNTSGQAFMGPDGNKYHMGGGEITNLETGYTLTSKEKKELLQDLQQKV